MHRKRQFSGVTKPRVFFDRKVRTEGDTRVISLGKVIPKSWTYVRVRVVCKTDSTIGIVIDKLLGGSEHEDGNKAM